ncbi:MATE family efflux transporter [Mobilitalea sibirica]|uniref:MATE family efflux transporter n=1 Tax=Mobilitalea sibirica TaxID=1462919 RepID=A0A8J7HCP3_9FIRM|nr:MATE family efflux transporter [Mobilitalea sibirica]MBH1942296.1 MATE family efflux transporter [Mobilitalea sibirica]
MNRIKRILSDKSFLRKTFVITMPIVLQNLLNNMLNLIDTLMIGRLGETTVAAVGLANKVFFVFSLLMFGICSGSGILAAQYWGKRELLNIRRVLRMSLLIGVGGSILFLIPGVLFPNLVMRIFTPQEGTIAVGAVYLAIIAFSYPLTAVTNAYVAILRSMNYVKLPVIITLIAIHVNVILNYALIFGKFGLPKMGVAGAALATLIARFVEFAVLLFLVYRHKPGDDGVGDFIHLKHNKEQDNGLSFFHRNFVYKYFHTAAPVIANEFMWGLGVTMYSLVYGRMGDAAMAAITITNTVEQVALVFFFGICAAAAIILGNEMGADELDRAEDYAKNYIILQFGLTVVGAVMLYLLKEPIIAMFDVSILVEDYIRLCITVFVIYMPARMLNALFIVAILRSGGDTRAALFLDVSSVWLIGIPMAVLGGLIFDLPIYIVYAMILLEEIYKLILGFKRYRKKKWLRNIVSS